MKTNEYEKLTLNERAELLWSDGQYLMERFIYGKYQIKLYKLYDFYVEVFCKLEQIKIEKLEVINEDQVVEMYADLREIYLHLRDSK